MKRGERTRQLIEIRGLVAKIELVAAADDGRDGKSGVLLWRHRGRRGFEEPALPGGRASATERANG